MTKEEKHNGLLMRAFSSGADLVMVVEPGCGACWQLAETLTEIRFIRPKVPENCLADIKKNLDDLTWITVRDDKSVVLEGELFEQISFDCDVVVVTERKLDYDEIRDKFLALSRIFKDSEKNTGAQLRQNRGRADAILKFIAQQRQKWTLKRDFFQKTDPVKGKAFDARLEVLADIEKIMTTDANASAQQ